MDYSVGKQYARTTTSGVTMEGRRSFEAAPAPAARLHKQRSSHGMRSASHGQSFSFASAPHSGQSRGSGPVSGGFDEGTKARKGSIRNAVRKIFGRRSRDSIAQGPGLSGPPPSTSSRHTYHRSEPTALSPQPELPEPQPDDDVVQRVLSDSYQSRRTPSMSRTGSPYAVQFPNSVRLKPMDLGNPFMAGPSQLRRRKTLPSLLIEEREGAAAIAGRSVEPREVEDSSFEQTRDPPSVAQRTPSSIKKTRRKSRSVDDLHTAAGVQQATPRKRSEEIRYWRESFQPDVLRASGFVAKSPTREDEAADRPTSSGKSEKRESFQEQGLERAPMPQIPGSYGSATSREGTLRSSPPGLFGHALSANEVEYRPSSGVGTEMSRDLEDRVAKLEAGLHNFQRSLQKLAADRNRRTVILGGSITTRRSSGDMRTPSLLADTLADPLEPSSYEYEYGHTLRPSTSPPPPRPPPAAQVQGAVDDPFGPDLPPVLPSGLAPVTARSPSPLPQATPETVAATIPGSGGPASQQPQQYTFRSLYQMLSDERSARRKLESQLHGLQAEIADLHTQVNLSSNIQSARSSYMLAGSSSRLQDLLRETEESGPPQPRAFQRFSSVSGVSTGSAPKVSRFSGSGSDVVQQEETDYEEYLTPREERSNWSLADKLERENKENEMF